MKLFVATRSAGKQREFRRLLAGLDLEIVFPEDLGLVPAPAEQLLEMHETFQGNAVAKAEHFFRLSAGLATVADDSGLEVLALGGEPGVKSKRWSGVEGTPDVVDAANNAYLVQRLAGAPDLKRGARFRAVIALFRGRGKVPEIFEGACPGRILTEPRGTGGFGYDPLFFCPAIGKTFGEASPEEKAEVSHRAIAVRALRETLAV